MAEISAAALGSSSEAQSADVEVSIDTLGQKEEVGQQPYKMLQWLHVLHIGCILELHHIMQQRVWSGCWHMHTISLPVML